MTDEETKAEVVAQVWERIDWAKKLLAPELTVTPIGETPSAINRAYSELMNAISLLAIPRPQKQEAPAQPAPSAGDDADFLEAVALSVHSSDARQSLRRIAKSLREPSASEPIPESELVVGEWYLCWSPNRQNHRIAEWRTGPRGSYWRTTNGNAFDVYRLQPYLHLTRPAWADAK